MDKKSMNSLAEKIRARVDQAARVGDIENRLVNLTIAVYMLTSLVENIVQEVE